MALNQNQFAMSTLKGTKDSGLGTVLEVQIYDASATTEFVAGEMVCIGSTTAPNITKVIKGTGLTSAYFGVILTNPLKASFYSGDKVQIAILGSIVLVEASAPITAGASLQYDYSTAKFATQTASNTIVGIAMENAAADTSLFRMMVFQKAISGATGATGDTGATGPTGPTGDTGPTGP